MTAPDHSVPPIPLGVTKILVVEHEQQVAVQLCRELTALGFKICNCVATGADAIAAAQASRPDLVLINAVLPGDVSGIRAAEAISSMLQVPILFLSAYSDEQTVIRALAAQPYAYLTKPFNIRELYAQLLVSLAKGQRDSMTREALLWYEATLRGVADAVIVIDGTARVRYLNPAAERLIGVSQKEALGHDIDGLLHLQDLHGAALGSPFRELISGTPHCEMPAAFQVRGLDETLHTVEDAASPIYSSQGDLLGALMVLRDTQQRTEAEQKLRLSEERFRNAFDLAPNGMALASPEGRFIQVNDALCRMLRAEPAQLNGRLLDEFCTGDVTAAAQLRRLHDDPRASVQFEQSLMTGTSEICALVSASEIRRPLEPDMLLLQLHDLTERKKAEQRLTHLAHFDALTDLPNRAAISEEIERQINVARRHGHRLAVVFLDLDYFKHVNDSLGHEAGDELLRVIAQRLRRAVREADMVGRLGGDEFIVLLGDIKELSDVVRVAAKMQSECLKPVQLLGNELRVGISLGVSLFPDDASDPRTLLRYADSAMYKAKTAGRNTLQFYRQEMTSDMEQRLRLGANLRDAVARGELELYFQPIVSFDCTAPHGAEALLRWHHPELGLLGPDEFLPVAEDIGLSAELGQWVLEAACRAATAWPVGEKSALHLAVNVSPSQFRKGNLRKLVGEALALSGLPAHRLCLEITEQVVLENNDWNNDILHSLKELGVRISSDDFGTGYSSLSYLIHFSPNEMKIDRSLIQHVCDDREHAAIVRAAVAMAHSLQLKVVTEGVESAAQHDVLKDLGCDLAQGYWYLRPCPADEFQQWMVSRQTGGGGAARM
jgi:diguanylate cyclase (GGDEF)-like protein/PAS domain S-box-containing protein